MKKKKVAAEEKNPLNFFKLALREGDGGGHRKRGKKIRSLAFLIFNLKTQKSVGMRT